MLITVISDTAGIRAPEVFETNLALDDWLIDYYGNDGPSVPIRVFDGSISDDNEIDLANHDRVKSILGGNVFVVQNPCGPFVAQLVIAVVVAIVATALIPTPRIPDGVRQPKKSPNNALNDQSNIGRIGNRVPEIFGKNLCYPDLISPTVTFFDNNVKIQVEYICIGRGFHDVENFRNGSTLISSIAGSTVEIFQPNTIPNGMDAPLQIVSGEVNGQELLPPNFENITLSSAYGLTYDAINDRGTITTPIFGEFNIYTVGNSITLNSTYLNAGDVPLSGTYVIYAITSSDITLTAAATIAPGWGTGVFPGIVANYIDDGSGGTIFVSPFISSAPTPVIVGPFILPDGNQSVIWADLIAPKGLALGGSLDKPLTVDINFHFTPIDSNDAPIGPPVTIGASINGNSTREVFKTQAFFLFDGDTQRYQVEAERITETNYNTSTVDQVLFSQLSIVNQASRLSGLNTTRAVVRTRATDQVASFSEKRLNCEATRRTVTWNGSSVVGDINTGVGLTASRKFADAFLHYFIDPALAARDQNSLDIQALYDIQAQLDSSFSGEKGEFSFVFDGNSTPALEELRIIANSCRCFVTRKGSYFSIVRDQPQNVSRALFNRRNKRPDSESKSIRWNKLLDRDGVELEYLDIETNELVVIKLPDDLPMSDPNYGLPNTLNPIKVEAAGIRNRSQAWDRAQYELNRLIHKRVTIESSVGADGGLLAPNARISHVDGTKLAKLSSDGEVRAVNGLTITTSERCIFEAGQTYSVIFRSDDGEDVSSPILAAARTDTEFGFILSSAPPFVLHTRGDSDYQRGALYNFGPDGDEEKDLYLVQEIAPDGDFYYNVTMINYSPLYYQGDNDTAPEI